MSSAAPITKLGRFAQPLAGLDSLRCAPAAPASGVKCMRFTMKIRSIILSLLTLFASHSFADVKEFMCGIQTKEKEFKEIEGFSVLIESQKEKIEIPNGFGTVTTAVMCWRSSLLPQNGDHKVILLGYPFYIIEQSDN
ncbi:hypothetical protein, partial [Microbulbifer aestuariivivens]|uniref:hypothetical protein n=1 Tax=Microbulbifer aestuariivivens TaxID=1908308 RepID=UPI0031F172AF